MSCFKMMFCKYNVDSVGSQLANYRCFCKIYLSLSSSRSHLHCSTRLILSKHYHRIRFRKHKRWESYLFYFPSCRSTKKNTKTTTNKKAKQTRSVHALMDGRLRTNNWSESCIIVTEFKNTLNHFLIVTFHATWILEGPESGFTPRNQWNRPKTFN